MKKLLATSIVFLIQTVFVFAQSANATLQNGNTLYQLKKYPQAQTAYEAIIAKPNITLQQKADALYNQGNALCKQQKWQEAIDCYKNSLAITPNSQHAKYNLCYAKSKLPPPQKQPQNSQSQKEKEQKNKEQQKQPQQSQPQHAPEPPKVQANGRLNKQQAEQLLQALQQAEKKLLQKKMQNQQGGASSKKDW